MRANKKRIAIEFFCCRPRLFSPRPTALVVCFRQINHFEIRSATLNDNKKKTRCVDEDRLLQGDGSRRQSRYQRRRCKQSTKRFEHDQRQLADYNHASSVTNVEPSNDNNKQKKRGKTINATSRSDRRRRRTSSSNSKQRQRAPLSRSSQTRALSRLLYRRASARARPHSLISTKRRRATSYGTHPGLQ